MQITEISASGLKREYKVVINAAALESTVNEKLEAVRGQVNMPGFRPGKAPAALIKKQYGRALLGEAMEESVNSALQKTLEDNKLRPAMQPKVDIQTFEEGKDFECTIAVEVLPEIVPGDFKQIKLERLVVEPNDTEVEEFMTRLSDQQKTYEKADKVAEKGDQVVIDFSGSVDGVKFDGGTATDYPLVLGSNSFIPGFEDQLVGMKVGEQKIVKVTFPEAYGNSDLAGKPADFDCTLKEVRAAAAVTIDDEFAKRFGLQSLQELKDNVKRDLGSEYKSLARMKMKRGLLDQLADQHSFDVPPGMVEMEFGQIWNEISSDKSRLEAEMAEEKKSEDELKAEYQKIAERRIRLGLLLSEIGRINNIEVKSEEITRAMIEQARRFPGQERQVMEYFQKNPEAAQSLRAPIFEDKVIDFIVEMATVTDKTVTKEELQKEVEAVS
ncbi:trigger factor [Ferrovibrio terrae]|uniref:Trigger factor n=1 Tax=Ferrovibrio terrae TaxID=2594003 RepID=A0A516H3L7_9PROT|nr:trigger factor [Ferrovibrio terrae]QDO98367.1 trigger factor [Ferrovibrio terrae]